MKDKYSIGIYLRISRQDAMLTDIDKINKESDSIEHQRELIEDYILREAELARSKRTEFLDDGFSGTNFVRPGFDSLMKNIEEKKINCVIVKDLSRLGRNYLEVGNYIENIFPKYGIRMISINDFYDSIVYQDTGIGIQVPLYNIINDLYSKDISSKVKTSLNIRKKEGYFMGVSAPYGYDKSVIHQGKLEVDQVASKIVQAIYQMALDGKSYKDIARWLNRKEIPTPMDYIKQKNKKEFIGNRNIEKENNKIKKSLWTGSTISRILHNQVYAGYIVNGKEKAITIGRKQKKLIPKEDWIIVPDCHKPIITKEVYQGVQDILEKKQRKSITHTSKNGPKCSSIFEYKKLIYCGHCNHVMGYRNTKNPYFYCCYGKYQDTFSCIHKVSEKCIYDIISLLFQRMNEISGKTEKSFGKEETMSQLATDRKELKEGKSLRKTKIYWYEEYKKGRITHTMLKERLALGNINHGEKKRKTILLETHYSNELTSYGELINMKTTDGYELYKRNKNGIEKYIDLLDKIYIYDDVHIEIKFLS